MTPLQFDRWRDFALRMARTCFRRQRRPSAKWIEEAVVDFIDGIDKRYIPCIVDWDNSEDYPTGHAFYRRTYRCPCWNCYPRSENVKKKALCPYRCEGGEIFDYAHPYCVGDMLMEWKKEYIWYGIYNLMTESERRRADKMDDDDRFKEAVEDRFETPVHSCVRAGLDCASAPSAGVMGFTAGDLRRMYPEGVPDWVKGNEPWNTVTTTGVIPGVGFTMDEPVPNGTFDELPDEARIWI